MDGVAHGAAFLHKGDEPSLVGNVHVGNALAERVGQHFGPAPCAGGVGLQAALHLRLLMHGLWRHNHEGIHLGRVHGQTDDSERLDGPALLRNGHIVAPDVCVGRVPTFVLDQRLYGATGARVLHLVGIGRIPREPLVRKEDYVHARQETLQISARVNTLQDQVLAIARHLVGDQRSKGEVAVGIEEDHGILEGANSVERVRNDLLHAPGPFGQQPHPGPHRVCNPPEEGKDEKTTNSRTCGDEDGPQLPVRGRVVLAARPHVIGVHGSTVKVAELGLRKRLQAEGRTVGLELVDDSSVLTHLDPTPFHLGHELVFGDVARDKLCHGGREDIVGVFFDAGDPQVQCSVAVPAQGPRHHLAVLHVRVARPGALHDKVGPRLCQLRISPRVNPAAVGRDILRRGCGRVDVHKEVPHHVLGLRQRGLPDQRPQAAAPEEGRAVDQLALQWGRGQDARAVVDAIGASCRNGIGLRTEPGRTGSESPSGWIDNLKCAEGVQTVRLRVLAVGHRRPPHDCAVGVHPFDAVEEDALPTARRREPDSTPPRRHVGRDATLVTVLPELLPYLGCLAETQRVDLRLERVIVEEKALVAVRLRKGRPGGVQEFRPPPVPEVAVHPREVAEPEVGRSVVVQVSAMKKAGYLHGLVPRVWQGHAMLLQEIQPHDRNEKITVKHEEVQVVLAPLPVLPHLLDLREDILPVQLSCRAPNAIVERLGQAQGGSLREVRVGH
mmetsp:Transcript_92770/g.276738  ORF Transcript_92770/g.276738 Transcript_92770/m.276738 type:complete len:725 (-) Transcript_92770:379-2553(-)